MYEKVIQQYLKKYSFDTFHLKAAFLDMDGVLFDSMPNHASSWISVMSSRNISFEEKDAYLHEGRTGRSTIQLIFRHELHREPSKKEIKEIYGEKTALFDSMAEAPVMKGAPELLATFKNCGLMRVLVTGSGQKMLLNRLEHHFPGHFKPERMVTGFDVTLGKPDPEPYLKALEKTRLEANEAVVIENAPLGIHAAKAANIFTIAVNTGLLEDFYLEKAGADLIFHSLDELREKWSELMNELNRYKH